MRSERRPNPDRSLESLEARLRALPKPPVPADLEARLQATIPAKLPIPPRDWVLWVRVVGAMAAACLLAVLAWPGRDGKSPVSTPPTSQPTDPVAPRQPVDSAKIAAWRIARQGLDEEMPAFTWPLAGTELMRGSTSIPPDLLD
jgi:hypothetical protein